jgi:hypothetical protein
MTNHVPLIFRITDEGKLGSILGDFKRFTSKPIVKAIKENGKKSRKEFLLEHFKEQQIACLI